MHFPLKASSYIALFLSQYAQAKPIAQGSPATAGLPCESETYTITDQKRISGQPIFLKTSCTGEGPNSCGVGRETSYSVEVTVTAGVDLSLGEIVGAGVSGSVSITTAKGTVNTSSVTCTGPWTCSIIVTPVVVQVKGIKKITPCANSGSQGSEGPYDVTFPETNDDKLPVGNTKPCACPDFEHWEDPGAPEKCPGPCGGN